MSWLVGLLGLAGYSVLLLLIGWHVKAPPWAKVIWMPVKWAYNQTLGRLFGQIA